jgi:hydrogenase expression/formation protein HypD
VKYSDEFRSAQLIARCAQKIRSRMPAEPLRIMEVCGTHTHTFNRFSLASLLPKHLKLISGPGCPVCVSPNSFIDEAIALAREKDVLLLTFGDMLRIPGTRSSLEKERAVYGNIKIVYSPLDCLRHAQLHAKKKIVFLSVGFETTAPTIALSLLAAKEQRFKNIFFLSSLKLIPPAMELLAADRRVKLDGFLCPGHVSAIIGTGPYESLCEKYGIGCCVAGFEPADILEGLYFLVLQSVTKKARVENQYTRVVKPNGNTRARAVIAKVFNVVDSEWRGLGEVRKSGLTLRKDFSRFDARREFGLKPRAISARPQRQCKCGEVLKGLLSPTQCPQFSKLCTPLHPLGPCMVTSEGACNAYYKYKI